MLNERDERDDKIESPEESEYHFSDEDVSYEVEPETPKAAPPSGSRLGFINRLNRSKRMMISLAVFLTLVFVVYKMVAPVTTTQTTDIKVAAPAQQRAPQVMPQIPTTPAVNQVAQSPAPQVMPVAPTTATPQVEQQVYPATQVISPPAPAALQTMQQQPANQAPQGQQMPAQAIQQQMPAQAIQQQMPQAPSGMPQQAPNMVMQQQQPQQQVTYQMPPQQMQPEAQQMPVQQMQQQGLGQPPMQGYSEQQPAGYPGQPSVTSTTLSIQPGISTSTGAPPAYTSSASAQLNAQVPGGVDATRAAMAQQSQAQLSQLQNEYIQRINEFASQNKNLQSEVQTLNNRVRTLESQIHQLIQALTRTQAPVPVREQPRMLAPPPPPPPAMQPRISYNVQAIIPGRAWLRAENGETLTVAEGDIIRELGRVTKIDPYDGVVEVNTGNRVVALSYGNGG